MPRYLFLILCICAIGGQGKWRWFNSLLLLAIQDYNSASLVPRSQRDSYQVHEYVQCMTCFIGRCRINMSFFIFCHESSVTSGNSGVRAHLYFLFRTVFFFLILFLYLVLLLLTLFSSDATALTSRKVPKTFFLVCFWFFSFLTQSYCPNPVNSSNAVALTPITYPVSICFFSCKWRVSYTVFSKIVQTFQYLIQCCSF